MPNTEPDHIHVAVAVVVDRQGRVLIARRPDDAHQGGLWEFPGGKVEQGETIESALRREAHEELGINITKALPLIQVRHAYPDRHVLLDVWRVTEFEGDAHGRENQETAWVKPDKLTQYDFPAANKAIVMAASLPSLYLITPPEIQERQVFLDKLDMALQAGARLLQFRVRSVDDGDVTQLMHECIQHCRQYYAKLLLNTDVDKLEMDYDGLHLSSDRLMALNNRPVGPEKLLAASCHNLEEIHHAGKIGADFAVLSPVLDTPSHPGADTLGWDAFSDLTANAPMPVYALGGMNRDLVLTAQKNGAQGIAAISNVWKAPDVRSAVHGLLRCGV